MNITSTFSTLITRTGPAVRFIFHSRQSVQRRLLDLKTACTGEKELALLDGLHMFFSDSIPAAAAQKLLQVELLRNRLNSDHSPLTITNYGAGSAFEVKAESSFRTTVSRVNQGSSKSETWAKLLFCLLRYWQPAQSLEFGTCLGISAAYQSIALQENGFGCLTTMEGSPELAALAQKHLALLGLEQTKVITGPFARVLPRLLNGVGPLDYIFIDGHHDGKATLQYLDQLIPHLAENALLVFDDIFWSAGMAEAWHEVKGNRHVNMSFDIGPIGICLFSRKATESRHIRLI